MSTWKEWELSAVWANSKNCPDCRHTLIITETIAQFEHSTIFNGICPSCRKQYNVYADDETLTPNPQAVEQQERIDALEERIARLEAIVQKLFYRQTIPVSSQPPEPLQANPEEEAFRKQYGFLLG